MFNYKIEYYAETYTNRTESEVRYVYIVAREKPCKTDRKFAIYERESYRDGGDIKKTEKYLFTLYLQEMDILHNLVPPTTEYKIVGAIERVIERKNKKLQEQRENK